MKIDPVALAGELIRMDTVNSPQHEHACLEYIGSILEEAGYRVTIHRSAEGRSNLIAELGAEPGLPLCFTGHVDTVPFGNAAWVRDPLCGEIDGGVLHGRGAADMKGGVAAIVSAACACTAGKHARIMLILTSGEELGCLGAAELARQVKLPHARGLVVAEPTANRPACGHKGALWLKAAFKGVTAHGSMPHLGVNAAYKAAHAMVALEGLQFQAPPHPLGDPTLNIGTVAAGINVNSVPDRAEISIDIRSVPGLPHEAIRARLVEALGPEASFKTIIDLDPVWTDPYDVFLRSAGTIASQVTNDDHRDDATVPYFTDASVLAPALANPPTLILGPGEIRMAHRTDESCETRQIQEAAEIYQRMICAVD